MTSNSARFGGPSEEVSTDTGGEATEEDRHRLAEPGDALHGPQDGEGVPRLLQPTQETRAAPRPKDLQGISTPETTYIKCTRNAAMVQGCILFKEVQKFSKTEYLGRFCPKIQNNHQ